MPTKTKPDAALRMKRIFAEHIRNRMAAEKLSVSRFARATKTGRSAIQRILDPRNTAITLHTMARTAAALNLEISLLLKPRPISELMKIVDQGLEATSARQAAALEAQFLAGYYGKPAKLPHAKAPKELATA